MKHPHKLIALALLTTSSLFAQGHPPPQPDRTEILIIGAVGAIGIAALVLIVKFALKKKEPRSDSPSSSP
jgi:hypothetical protein